MKVKVLLFKYYNNFQSSKRRACFYVDGTAAETPWRRGDENADNAVSYECSHHDLVLRPTLRQQAESPHICGQPPAKVSV